MCGIFGTVGVGFKESEVQQVLSTIRYRGPDDSGVYIDQHQQVTLGHVRLSIVDLSAAGHQPMCFANLELVFNGEIYNYKVLREELVTRGYSFTSNSDTEVILKGFNCFGHAFIEKMIGMFALAIYDLSCKKLWIYRDRLGVKPLYYLWDHDKGILIFASELKAIKAAVEISGSGISLSMDQMAIQLYLLKGFIPAPHSLYQNIHKLKAGHYLEYDINARQAKTRCYWSLASFYQADKWDLPYTEIKKQLKALLIDACELRMVSDVPVGVFLSGGVDSNLVTALLAKECGYALKTFSLGVTNSTLNEADIAAGCAKVLGTEHHELYLSAQDLPHYLTDFFAVFDEPFGDSSAIPTLALSKFVKQHVGVALSADGGDELLGGYSSYLTYPKLWQKTRLNSLTRRALGMLSASQILSGELARKLTELLELSKVTTFAEFHWHKSCYFKVHELKKYLKNSEAVNFQLSPNLAQLSMWDTMMQMDAESYLPDDILVKVDRATMFYSLEGREPLLDHRLFEFCARIPEHYKIHQGTTKWIARDILSEYLDLNFLVKRKQGFSIPMAEWCPSVPLASLQKTSGFSKEIEQLCQSKGQRNQNLKWLLFVLAKRSW